MKAVHGLRLMLLSGAAPPHCGRSGRRQGKKQRFSLCSESKFRTEQTRLGASSDSRFEGSRFHVAENEADQFTNSFSSPPFFFLREKRRNALVSLRFQQAGRGSSRVEGSAEGGAKASQTGLGALMPAGLGANDHHARLHCSGNGLCVSKVTERLINHHISVYASSNPRALGISTGILGALAADLHRCGCSVSTSALQAVLEWKTQRTEREALRWEP